MAFSPKDILSQLNFIAQARKYRVPIWQYPPFLFALIGMIIVMAILLSYVIGTEYFPSEYVTLGILGVTTVLLILDFIIVNSFERLAEVNLMKSEFIDIISHQLRTPLSNLKWTIESVLGGRNSKREQEIFRNLKGQNDRMIALVNDIIYTSRIEEGKWNFKTEMVDVGSLVEKIVKDFFWLAKNNNIQVKVDIEKKLPKIITDPQKISHVLYNLLNNAIRYSRERGMVWIKLKKVDDRIYCEIKDSGIGITREDQKYIFKKFFRGRHILRYRTQGMGLGLFISKEIIRNCGGRIGFNSKEGTGSTFWIKLPIK
ncbi:MAG: HAMP domain-containing sensor histidine kinase [Candidatus Bathyarchaeota archaeon]|nr:HAMP domain-containing sensor histidine kinase [Candidatus Bathyarchaeota archaeon]